MARIDQASLGMAALIKVYGDTHDRKVHYAEERYDTNLGILWRMKVSVDGIELGQATRANKKTAKNVAALEAARALGLAVRPIAAAVIGIDTDTSRKGKGRDASRPESRWPSKRKCMFNG